MRRKDTSIEGFQKAGIKITEEQFSFLCDLNISMMCDPNVPVFHMMVLLREFGLLPKDMVVDAEDKLGVMIGKNDEQEEPEKKSCTEVWQDYFE